MSRELMQQALDALKLVYEQADFSNGVTDPTGTMDEGKVVIGGIVSDCIETLKAALAQTKQAAINQGWDIDTLLVRPEQKPVAYADSLDLAKDCNWDTFICKHSSENHEKTRFKVPLYTAPSLKEWVGLTKGELIDIKDCNRGFWTNAAKIEQLLKDKNT